MALDIGALITRHATASVAYLGETVAYHYYPARYTAAVHQQLVAAASGRDYEAVVAGLVPLLASWDLEFEGQPLAITAENLLRLPMPLLGELVLSLIRDVNDPNPDSTSPES